MEAANYGILSLVPLALTLALAFWIKDAVFALFLGCLSGVLLLGHDPAFGFSALAEEALGNEDFIWILLIQVFIGIMIAFFMKAGVVKAFAEMIAGKVRSPRSVKVATWFIGLFTIDAYMVVQARTLGADAILLIASILCDSQLEEYRLMAESLGMDALVEAHDEEEVERALRPGARVLGVNNRNLKDFTVDIGNSLRLRPRVPKNIPFVAESGIKSRQQTAALEQAGVNGVLIGETLMRSPDMKAALAELRGEIL